MFKIKSKKIIASFIWNINYGNRKIYSIFMSQFCLILNPLEKIENEGNT